MATQTGLSFSVRKSTRLSLKKPSSPAVRKENAEDETSQKSSGKVNYVVKSTYKTKDQLKESSSCCGNNNNASKRLLVTSEKTTMSHSNIENSPMKQQNNVSRHLLGTSEQSTRSPANIENSPVKEPTNDKASLVSLATLVYSPNSCASLTSPLRQTPSSPRLCGSPAEMSHVKRRLSLLSPSKRKSAEDGENTFQESVSPCKSQRPNDFSSPLTPKSSKKINSVTPHSSNTTPRRLFESPEKRQSLTVDENSGLSSPKRFSSLFKSSALSPTKPHTLNPQKANSRLYQTAKRCLHTAKPSRLIGREKETHNLEEFISKRVDSKQSGSLYVSGAPGTGKTAVITHVLDKINNEYGSIKTGYVNCMALKDANGVFATLHEQLTGKPMKGKDSMKAVEKVFVTSSSSVILVLDEIDQLDSKHQHILYRIFEWPAMSNSKLILIGIANALDLTDRILPRLQASETCRPDLMNFAPYTSSQITDILKGRLERDLIVEPSAINFCARKVSSVAGDIRKALDVCRRAVEMVEADVRAQGVLRITDCNSPTKRNQEAKVKKVTLVHISKVMADVYGSSVSAAHSTDSDFPLQQKIALCSLLVQVKNGKTKEVQLGKLHEFYARVCRCQNLASVDQSEFHSVLMLLESRGIVSLKKAKDTRLIKVSLKLDEQELEQTIKDKALMSQILQKGIA